MRAQTTNACQIASSFTSLRDLIRPNWTVSMRPQNCKKLDFGTTWHSRVRRFDSSDTAAIHLCAERTLFSTMKTRFCIHAAVSRFIESILGRMSLEPYTFVIFKRTEARQN